MGLGLYFVDGEGPKFERPIRTEADVDRLACPDPNVELRYVTDTVREVRRALANRIPLIGFSGSPFTLACYMVEGGGSRRFSFDQDDVVFAARSAASHCSKSTRSRSLPT